MHKSRTYSVIEDVDLPVEEGAFKKKCVGSYVLFVGPLDRPKRQLYLFEVVQVVQFGEDYILQIRLYVESLHTPVAEF